MDHLPVVELVTRTLAPDDPCEVVEGVRVDHGPVLEVPLDSRVAVEVVAGGGPPTVVVELLAARVRFVDRTSLPADPPSWDRTRQLLLAAGCVLRGGHVPDHVRGELAAAGDPDTSDVSGLGRLCEEHALAAAAPVPPLGPALDTECSLCHVPLSTGTCRHLLDLGDGFPTTDPAAVPDDETRA